MGMRTWAVLGGLAVVAAIAPAAADVVVGKIGTDWTGNDLIIEAVPDPKIGGIICHVAYFQRGLIDRLQQGNWFEDPSNASISCAATGQITVGRIELDRNGESMFDERRSLFFKRIVVNRVYDKANNTLIYVAFGREIQKGSAKMSISTVPLFNQRVIWLNGAPQ